MSNMIEEKIKTSVKTCVDNKMEGLKLNTAYDYLNQISFTVNGSSNKTIEVMPNDAVCLLGSSRMTNLLLIKIAVHCLMPKKYGGLRSSKVFVLDAGNCTDVYQFVDFMKQYGLNIKKNLKKIMISRVFTVYQLTHFLKYELSKTILEYEINIVVIPDLLAMFIREYERDFYEVKFLLTEIINILKTITHNSKILLITSLTLEDKLLPPLVMDFGNKIVKCFDKCVSIDKNKTNDKFKILIQQKQGNSFIAVKNHMSLTDEDLLTVTGR